MPTLSIAATNSVEWFLLFEYVAYLYVIIGSYDIWHVNSVHIVIFLCIYYYCEESCKKLRLTAWSVVSPRCGLGVDISTTPLLPHVIPDIGANPISFLRGVG